jgi:hypothetical protein
MWAMIEKLRVNSVDMAENECGGARRENAEIRRHGTKNPGRSGMPPRYARPLMQNSRNEADFR